MIRLTAATLALIAATGLDAEPVRLRVGDGAADGRRLSPYTNVWRFYSETDTGQIDELGLWHDRVQILSDAGGEIIRREQRTEPTSGRPALFVLNEMRRNTMAPVRAHFARGAPDAAFLDVRFDGATLTGRMPLAPTGGEPMPVTITLTTPEPVFDWTQWGLLLATFPLEEGYAGRFTGFNNVPTQAPLLDVTFEVTGVQAVPVPGRGDVECFVVEAHAGAPWTFWIARDRGAGPPIVKIRIDDSPTSRRWWVPVEP
ncbi:MAG: hypothetical protein D6693_09975 [Planctomycetota bacterium]|nr:MAG: hypothetical protein D6693_09975 [Planctomycetota bacterium]